jgi:hypothetical protein
MKRVVRGFGWWRMLVACSLAFGLLAVTASAAFASGREVLDGHDPDFHCGNISDPSCDFFTHAVPFARGGAPDPTLPVLVLDNNALKLQNALTIVFGAALPVQVVDPSSATFASLPIDTAHYSAIIVASDESCGGCDLNTSTATPDSDAITARKAAIQAFFQAGGGVIALSGGEVGSQPAGRCDVYYSFLPLPAPACQASVNGGPTFPVTPNGASLGFQDTDFPFPHNEFTNPAAGSALQPIALDDTQAVALFGAGPDATTRPATSVGGLGATLNGTVNPEFSATTTHFEYGTTTSYGSRAPASDASVGADGVNHAESLTIGGLQPNTTYHYRIVATNAAGTTNGADMTFTTAAFRPVATTGAATAVSTNGATLNGVVNPENSTTSYHFEYGTSTAYGRSTAVQNAGSGRTALPVTARLVGLSPGAVYHYRLVATSSGGTTAGADRTFSIKATVAVSGLRATGCTRANSTNIQVRVNSVLSPGVTVRLDGKRIGGGHQRSLKLRIALAKLRAGTHHVTVTAKSAAGTTTRSVAFHVCATKKVVPVFTG